MGVDVVTLLTLDHEHLRGTLARFGQEPREAWGDLFCEATHELVAHEVAEEQVVYPALRADASGGQLVAQARIAEQSEAEELLAAMEKMDPAGGTFAASVGRLRDAVLEHASQEEDTVFPLLRASEAHTRLVALGQRYERAKRLAPTHPHPHAPDVPPANHLLGPIAALFDRARDAARQI